MTLNIAWPDFYQDNLVKSRSKFFQRSEPIEKWHLTLKGIGSFIWDVTVILSSKCRGSVAFQITQTFNGGHWQFCLVLALQIPRAKFFLQIICMLLSFTSAKLMHMFQRSEFGHWGWIFKKECIKDICASTEPYPLFSVGHLRKKPSAVGHCKWNCFYFLNCIGIA